MNATPDPPSGPRRPRTTLGRYDLLTRLGSGGMADVYLAVARGPAGFHKLSVLKVLRPRVAQEEDFYAMFLDEARLSANFSHPNVVQTHGVEEDGGQHFLVMEYLEGRSLAQLQAEQRDLPAPLQLRALADALHGLHYVHELTGLDGQPYNVVHRDVSPQNVFVTYDGGAKILDFGVAKARNSLSHTREGTYKGKVSYMAPEQLLGEDIDRRADVFAAGILLFHALTGRRLWEGLDQLTIMHRLATREPVPAPHSLRADVHPALDAACVKALSLRPEDRFDTASELADVLEEYLRPLGAEASHRRLGRFLEERYAADRASFQASVDAHLRALRDAPAATPRGSGSIPAPPLARGSGAASGSIPAPPPSRSSGSVPGSIPAPPPSRSSGSAHGSIPAPPLARSSGTAHGSIPAPPLARGSGAASGSIP
ncbi:MAG TPA: protein kinase, partial [Polyangiaceae bacterium]|nr:protein kinase [Polyangiaceae bacterium]